VSGATSQGAISATKRSARRVKEKKDLRGGTASRGEGDADCVRECMGLFASSIISGNMRVPLTGGTLGREIEMGECGALTGWGLPMFAGESDLIE